MRSFLRQATARGASLVLPAALSTAALSLAGCLQSPTFGGSHIFPGAPPSHVTMVRPPPRTTVSPSGLRKVPPPLYPRHVPDDPTEPFSPNYGPAPDTRNEPTKPPPAPVRKASLTNAQADALIAQAIATHERHRP